MIVGPQNTFLAPETEEDDAEQRPIPIVNVACVPPTHDDDNLSSYMEVSQVALPQFQMMDSLLSFIEEAFTIAVNPFTLPKQLSPKNPLLSSKPLLKLAFKTATLWNSKPNSTFDKLDKTDSFDWWYSQVKARLKHEAWRNILADGEPYMTTTTNASLSNKLYQRIHQSLTAAKAKGWSFFRHSSNTSSLQIR
jgi:hypothetical protein